jgi:hypothetical protein
LELQLNVAASVKPAAISKPKTAENKETVRFIRSRPQSNPCYPCNLAKAKSPDKVFRWKIRIQIQVSRVLTF